MRRSARIAIAAAIVVCIGLAPRQASAHDDAGQIALVGTGIGADALTGDFAVDVTFQNDGHGAPAATVTLVAEDASGNRVGPVPMIGGQPDGRYTGSLTFPSPGAWTVRATSLSPSASLETPFVVTAPPASTTTLTTSTLVPQKSTTTSSVEGPAPDDGATNGDSSSNGSGTLLVVLGVIVVVVLGGGFAVWRSKAQSSDEVKS
jgi:hypothetical protein